MDPISSYVQDIYLLSLCTYYEARSEPYQGKLAVAYSILNRVRRPSWWGNDIPSVVFKKWQYSSMTDPNDAQFKRAKCFADLLPKDGTAWQDCLRAAQAAYEQSEPNPAPGADSYFADTIPPPNWADEKKFVVKIGHHSFYDLDSDHEREA